jgi:hypothetical protein
LVSGRLVSGRLVSGRLVIGRRPPASASDLQSLRDAVLCGAKAVLYEIKLVSLGRCRAMRMCVNLRIYNIILHKSNARRDPSRNPNQN